MKGVPLRRTTARHPVLVFMIIIVGVAAVVLFQLGRKPATTTA